MTSVLENIHEIEYKIQVATNLLTGVTYRCSCVDGVLQAVQTVDIGPDIFRYILSLVSSGWPFEHIQIHISSLINKKHIHKKTIVDLAV